MSTPTPPNAADELRLLVHSGWRLIALETFEEERGLALIEEVAAREKLEVHTWSVSSGIDDTAEALEDMSAGIEVMSLILERAVFVLFDAHRHLDDPSVVRRLRDWLSPLSERGQSVIFLGPAFDPPLELTREMGSAVLPLPDENELTRIFKDEEEVDCRDDGACLPALHSAVKASLGLTANEATRVLRKACRMSDGLSQATAAHIIREKRRALQRTRALSFHEPDGGLESVGGLNELKHWLQERKRAFSDEAQAFGLPMPRGLLLLGVQGCGKSLSAKAVAQEWRFPLLRLDLAEVFSGSTQSPEAAIREATAIADSIAPAILWIDEIEKGFAASSSGSERASRVFGSFLTWLAEKPGPVFVVATANDVKSLPPELLRRGRFDELFFVDLPTLEERMEILTIHLVRHGRNPLHFPIEEIAQEAERLSGAELEQVVAAGLYSAFARDRDLTGADLLAAVNETVPLYETYEDQIKDLRDWARGRARMASVDSRMGSLFG